MNKNIIVGQSGGPTSAINSSLAGVIDMGIKSGAEHVYGMVKGISGLLNEEYVDLGTIINDDEKRELLKRTPSSFLKSCRHRLPDDITGSDEYRKIFEILEKLDVGYFFYIGGNDSMDTILKLSKYAESISSDIKFIGVPKTIDNDLTITDHTPGYGSAAKYIATAMKEIIPDATVYGTSYVTVVEIMGRDAGWLTAASALAKSEDCEGVDLIYLPEFVFDMDEFVEKVRKLQEKKKSLVIAVSEGIKLADGRYVCEFNPDDSSLDAFGHRSLTGTSRFLAHTLNRELKTKSRYIELSTLQRCASHIASLTDINEAYEAGCSAVKAAYNGETGKVVVFERVSAKPYECSTGLADVADIANKERYVPKEWYDHDKCQMMKEYIDYARPLIEGELMPVYKNGVPRHIKL